MTNQSRETGGAGGGNDPPPNRNLFPRSHYDEYEYFIERLLNSNIMQLTEEQAIWLIERGPEYHLIIQSRDNMRVRANSESRYYIISLERRVSEGGSQIVVYSRRNGRDRVFSLATRNTTRNAFLALLRGDIQHVSSSISNSSLGSYSGNAFPNINFTVAGNQVDAQAHANPEQVVEQLADTSINQSNSRPSGRGDILRLLIGLIGSIFAARASGLNFPFPFGNIIHPGRNRLRHAGFQRGRQDFRDNVISTGVHFRNRFPFVHGSLPGRRRFQQNQICPPVVNLRDETQPAFLSGQNEGAEFERRSYQRANPSVPSGLIPPLLNGEPTLQNGSQTGLTAFLTLLCTTLLGEAVRRRMGPNNN